MTDLANLFSSVINLSAVASVVILFVLAARLFLRSVPRVFSYALWAIVLVRLLIPLSIQSPVSVVPETPSVEQFQINQALPELEFETPSDRQENIQSIQNADQISGVEVQINRSVEPVYYLTILWLAGIGAMTFYSILSYLRIRKKVRISIRLRDNIYLADDIQSPFVMGLLRPRIYLPGSLPEGEQSYIILHEQHHIRRLDHWCKALAFLALTIHWFNPLVWLAFVLSAKDMEMSCDEAVIRKAGEGIRAEYSASLLTLATGKRIIAGTPLAFGEGDTKGRIRNLANWKRPGFWVILIAVIVCVAMAVCLLTDPVSDEEHGAGISYYFGTVVDSGMSVVNEGDRQGRSYITLRMDDGEEKLFWLGKDCESPDDILNQYVMVRSAIERETGLDIVTSIRLTDPVINEYLEAAVQEAMLSHHAGKYYPGQCQTAHFKLLSREESGIVSDGGAKAIKKITLYGIVLYSEYNLTDGILESTSGARVPTVLTFSIDDRNEVILTEYWEPRDGSHYPSDIKAKFKDHPWPDTSKYLAEQELACYLQAAVHFDVAMETVIHSILTDIVNHNRWHDGFESLMEDCKADREMLAALGTDTLKYCFTKFLEGGNDTLYGQIMAFVSSEIMEELGEPPLDNWSFQQSGQDWFRAIKARARALAENGAYLKSSYPGTYLLISMDESVLQNLDWGLRITAENVTPSGMTLVVTQSGGMAEGQLITGQPYFLQRYKNGEWTPLEPLLEAWTWTMEAWSIPVNDTVRWGVNWEWLYGKLEPGQYRFGKTVSKSFAPGDSEEAVFYVEFVIA